MTERDRVVSSIVLPLQLKGQVDVKRKSKEKSKHNIICLYFVTDVDKYFKQLLPASFSPESFLCVNVSITFFM